MAEKVKSTGVTKQSGYLYYLDKNGNVIDTHMGVIKQEELEKNLKLWK